jgi:hypothetical protein
MQGPSDKQDGKERVRIPRNEAARHHGHLDEPARALLDARLAHRRVPLVRVEEDELQPPHEAHAARGESERQEHVHVQALEAREVGDDVVLRDRGEEPLKRVAHAVQRRLCLEARAVAVEERPALDGRQTHRREPERPSGRIDVDLEEFSDLEGEAHHDQVVEEVLPLRVLGVLHVAPL